MQNLTITLTDRKNTFRTSLGTNNELRVVLHRSSQGFLEQETAEALSQCWELLEFQLGDELSTNTLLKPAPQPSVHSEHNAQDLAKNLYIIGEGRVRLLGFDPQKGREVSVGVLQGGDTFGADAGWGNESLPYQVVAASSGWMACISWEQLQPWLERCPELATHWRQQAQQRQCLSFLKTLTSLRSQSSLILQQLLIYIEETQIPVGDSLADFAASQPGYYWLRSGQIHTQEQTDKPNCQPPTIGEGWGYPQEVPTDWVAQTELSVYRLPQASWEAAQEIVPTLAPGDGSDTNGKTAKPTLKASPKKRLTPVSSVPSPTISTQAAPNTQPQSSDTQSIAFPQPATKRYRGRQFWRGYPFIQQQSSSDCGPTCLAMIGRYWGKRFSINTLRELAGVGRAGASLTGLTKAAQTLSFQATPVRASLSRIAEQQNPWIAHWQGDHYVVVYRVKGDRVLMADPAMGKRLVPRQEFLTNWTGFALLLEPTAQLAAMPDEKLSLKRFWGLLWPHRGILLQVILASLMLQVFGLITI